MIKVSSEYFDIKATLECGQFFRYHKNDDGSYFVCSLDKRCRIWQEESTVYIETNEDKYFYNFFDLHTDYSKIVNTLSKFRDISDQVNYGKGIRILRQDLTETVISFIISANNNITRIKNIIERICARCGKNMGEYYAFPTLKELQTLSVEEFRALGLGYRAEYLYNTCREFEGKEEVVLAINEQQTAQKVLCKFMGIGPKVADCIMLFGMHLTRSYPVDTWIFKANKTEILNTPQKVREYYLDRYGEYAGFAQQYIFYYARENKIE